MVLVCRFSSLAITPVVYPSICTKHKSRIELMVKKRKPSLIPLLEHDYILIGIIWLALVQGLMITKVINISFKLKKHLPVIGRELLIQFRKVEQMPINKKKLVIEFLDAFIFKNDLQKQLQG